jgi:hypothetical protein
MCTPQSAADVPALERRIAALEADQQDDDAALLTAIAEATALRRQCVRRGELFTATKLFPPG